MTFALVFTSSNIISVSARVVAPTSPPNGGGIIVPIQSFCTLHPNNPICIIQPFCTLYPNDPICIQSFCTLNPNDPVCVAQPSFCTLHPNDPSCFTQPFCTLHPTDQTCIIQPFCVLNPNASSCIVQPFCTLHPNDPVCLQSFCILHPNDPACSTQSFCTLHPNDLSCIANQVFQTVSDSFSNVMNIIGGIITQISGIIQTPEGDLISKIIIIAGAIVGMVISLATALFASPLSSAEIFLIPLRLWDLVLIAFGIKKRSVPWGTVYNSVTKEPLDPAYVILQDLNGNEIATSITDIDGRYGFLAPDGQYRMIANKTNYSFPSKKMVGKERDELYQDLYFSEIFDVKDGEVITKNIPMDPIKFDWNEFAKRDQKLMKFFSRRELWIARIADLLFYFGFVTAIITILVSPIIFNIVILAIYLLLFILKRTILKPRAFGSVWQKESHDPLSFAIIRIFFVGGNREVAHKVTNKTGKYYCLLSNGNYYVKIEKKNPDESYSLVYTSEPIEVKKGYINKKFIV